MDSLQPWGHDKYLQPDSNKENYKLNWLEAAGNINLSLPDYARFVYLQLLGLQGKLSILSQKDFQFLHFGLEEFAVGWFTGMDENRMIFSYNLGNPGTFLSKVFVFPEADRAYILFANAQTAEADKGMNILLEKMKVEFNQGKVKY